MEVFLHLWDELDDLAAACRHIATATALEAASLAKPVARACITAVLAAAAGGHSWYSSLKNLW